MTLILSLAAGHLVLHVGDRRLTRAKKPWDALANKSILLLGVDGYACVSYSGLAHIDGHPTDEWLAEQISERPSKRMSPGAGPAWLLDQSLLPRVGLALNRLPATIERDFGRQNRAQRANGLYVLATGFLARHRRSPRPMVRPFMVRYSHQGRNDQRVVVDTTPRYWNWQRQLKVGRVGAAADTAHTQLLAGLGSAQLRNQDDCERLLVDCIRSVSATDPTVGPDCLSCVVSKFGDVRVRFLPEPTSDSRLRAYTPWVIAPGCVWPPTVLYGGLPTLHAGAYTVEFDRVPALPNSMPSGAIGQPRRPTR